MEDLNTCNSDGLAFVTQLFCPKGTLKHKHRSDKHKYVGPWGSELETGGVLVLKYLCVEKEFRRQGMAGMLLDKLVERAKERTGKKVKGVVKFVVVFPAVIKEDFEAELVGKTDEEKQEIEKRAYDNAVGFYRAHGSRRIGLSRWFGLVLDPEHRSRRVAVEDDLDIPGM
jgi:GNAT superfamily N-acetyltransferase